MVGRTKSAAPRRVKTPGIPAELLGSAIDSVPRANLKSLWRLRCNPYSGSCSVRLNWATPAVAEPARTCPA